MTQLKSRDLGKTHDPGFGLGRPPSRISKLWMRCVMTNITLNLCHGGLQEIEEIKYLETTLIKDKIAYRESVGDTIYIRTS